jgi:formylglycine-generating enzyme required for sulfatase activity
MRPALALFALVAGCASPEYVVVDVSAIPAGATRLIARSALDDWPAQSPEEFSGTSLGGATSFALQLGAGVHARLAVAVEAWDASGCPVAAGAGFVDLDGSTQHLPIPLAPVPASACAPSYQRTPGMVDIPAGTFTMGCQTVADPNCESDETNVHNVTLSAFEIDATEVTTAAYHACTQHGACTAPFLTLSPSLRAEAYVTWDQALAYCQAHGKRLPTEAEWERAARGDDRRIYPWGNDTPTCSRANFQITLTAGCRETGDRVAPVGSLGAAGASPYGGVDMSGNVEEWVSDWYTNMYPTTAQTNPTGPATGIQKVLRGGSWVSPAAQIRASRRNANAPDASAPPGIDLTPEANSSTFGIRCARAQ